MSNILNSVNAEIGTAWEKLCKSIDVNSKMNPRVNELIRLACVVVDRSNSGIRLHTKQALKLGITQEEIISAVFACLPVTGIESVACGLQNVLEEIKNYRGENYEV